MNQRLTYIFRDVYALPVCLNLRAYSTVQCELKIFNSAVLTENNDSISHVLFENVCSSLFNQPFLLLVVVVLFCLFILVFFFFLFFFLSFPSKTGLKGSDFRIICFHLLALFASQCFQVCKLFNRFAVSGLAERGDAAANSAWKRIYANRKRGKTQTIDLTTQIKPLWSVHSPSLVRKHQVVFFTDVHPCLQSLLAKCSL